MNRIVAKKSLNPTVTQMDIEAPLVAKKAQPGQFIILRVDADGERIPLTVAGCDRERGTVRIIFQIVGATTELLNRKQAGESIQDFVGPLGVPTHVEGLKKVCVVGGGGQLVGHRDDEFRFDAIHIQSLLLCDEGVQKRPGLLPLPAVLPPLLPAGVGDGVVPPPCPGAVLSPAGGDQPRRLQPFERGVEGGLLEAVFPAGSLPDGLVDLIAVVVAPHQLGQDDGIRVPPQGVR